MNASADTITSRIGWPKCAVCQKPVDEVLIVPVVGDIEPAVVVRCHGETEVVRIPVREVLNDSRSEQLRIDGWAFQGAKKLGDVK